MYATNKKSLPVGEAQFAAVESIDAGQGSQIDEMEGGSSTAIDILPQPVGFFNCQGFQIDENDPEKFGLLILRRISAPRRSVQAIGHAG